MRVEVCDERTAYPGEVIASDSARCQAVRQAPGFLHSNSWSPLTCLHSLSVSTLRHASQTGLPEIGPTITRAVTGIGPLLSRPGET
jgi:hypothetical protein